MNDSHFCPDCWDARSAAAPPRCKRPTMHQTTRVVKVTLVLEDSDGGKMIIESDDFDWVEMDIHRTNPPQSWFDGTFYRETLMDNDHEIGVQVHRAKTYRIYPGDKPDPTPVLDDPNIVEADDGNL